jgi:hypothetical protein
MFLPQAFQTFAGKAKGCLPQEDSENLLEGLTRLFSWRSNRRKPGLLEGGGTALIISFRFSSGVVFNLNSWLF